MKKDTNATVGRKLWAIQSEMLAAINPFAYAQLMTEQAALQARPMALADEEEREDDGKVAVLTLRGVITPYGSLLLSLLGLGGGGLEGFRAMFREALADDSVGAIVLNIDSPGGLVDQVPETAAEIRGARGTKPIVAVSNTMAASAAYYIASQADELVATPSGEVGSIGVLVRHEDFSGMLAMEGVKPTLIYAGKYKVDGNPYEPLSESAKEGMQAAVDEFYGMFTRDVAAGRGISVETVVSDYGEGKTLLAEPALAAGMVDKIATLDETIVALGGDPGSPSGGRSSRRAGDEAPKPTAVAPAAGDDSPTHEPETVPALSAEYLARLAALRG